jgi:hypothetical protein
MLKFIQRMKAKRAVNSEQVLASLKRDARRLAELTFEASLENPPRSRMEIESAMRGLLAKEIQASLHGSGVSPFIAKTASDVALTTMCDAFSQRYAELLTHGASGSEARN